MAQLSKDQIDEILDGFLRDWKVPITARRQLATRIVEAQEAQD